MKSFSPDDLGKKCVVEECQKMSINPFLRSARAKLLPTILASEIEASGVSLLFTTSQSKFGVRYWFKCPSCGKRVGTVYAHPITNAVGCRACLDLEYRARRFKGMVESLSEN